MADLDDDDIEYSVRACTFVILSLSFDGGAVDGASSPERSLSLGRALP